MQSDYLHPKDRLQVGKLPRLLGKQVRRNPCQLKMMLGSPSWMSGVGSGGMALHVYSSTFWQGQDVC